uniref:Knottin scorpion toxin-like domain-containing protein n=1 Tax=Setaria italica TaxID=4555 RepID=K3ZKL9_SETIT
MGRIVHYLMATSFVVLVMISTNSPSCQACLGPWCFRRTEPCFQVTHVVSDDYCRGVCEVNHVVSNRAYCTFKRGKRRAVWQCCCPR